MSKEERDTKELLQCCLDWMTCLEQDNKPGMGTLPTLSDLTRDIEALGAMLDGMKGPSFTITVPAPVLSNAAWSRLTHLMEQSSLQNSTNIDVSDIDEGHYQLDIMKAVALKTDHLVIHIQHEEKTDETGPK